MYLPYLRGKQFELLALTELLQNNLLSENIIPIIEPIKFSSTFINTINIFIRNSRNIVVIHNPKVGNLYSDINEEDYDTLINMLRSDYVIVGHIMNENSHEELDRLQQYGINKSNVLAMNIKDYNLPIYLSEFNESEPLGIVIDNENILRNVENRIILTDGFNKKCRNADYSEFSEVFSDMHLFYRDRGFHHFSDYSIIGNNYTEDGWAAYAIAIHIVFFNCNNVLNIRHFVSDSNNDRNNPAQKYNQALSKLNRWQLQSGVNSYAINSFIDDYRNSSYHGQGIIKKLSIMHHMQLMGEYLDSLNN